jgi:hypothetical protein
VIKVSVEADSKPLEDVGKASDTTSTKAVALGTVLGNVATSLGKMALEAVKAGAALAKDLVFGVAESADEMAKMAKQLAVDAEELQRLRGAADLSGSSIQDMDRGIRSLTKGLADAQLKGTGPVAEGLEALGLTVEDIDGLLGEGKIEDAIGVIGDAFNRTGESAEKNAALMKLFGARAGSQLRPLIESGAKGIKSMGDEIERTGEVISNEALPQFEKMQDDLRLVEGRITGMKNQIAIALAPAVSDIATKFSGWIDENRSFIEQDLPKILESIGDGLVSTATFLFELLTSWREFIRDASDLAEILTSEVEPGMSGVGNAFATAGDIIDGVSLAVADLTVQLLEAVGASESLIQVFKEIRSAVQGDDQTTTTERGAGAQLGGAQLEGGGTRSEDVKNVGGQALAPKFDRAIETRDTSELAAVVRDPAYADEDRARAASLILDIDREDADRAALEQGRAQAEKQVRAEANQRRRSRRRPAKPSRRGGGGRRGKAGPALPSVDELIAGVAGQPGGAGPAALRAASNALSGTLLVSNDNRIQITVSPSAIDVGGVSISAELPAQIGQATAEEIERIALGPLTRQIRDAIELAGARRNVGP